MTEKNLEARASAATQAVTEPVSVADECHAAHRCLDAAVLHLTGSKQWPSDWLPLRDQFLGIMRSAYRPAAPVVPPVALPAKPMLDAALREMAAQYGCHPDNGVRFARAILAASAAPAPEQMQPNAQDKGHSIAPIAGAPCGDEAVEPERIEIVRHALHRAYQLGQTYWREADSESYAANKRSAETAIKMEQLSADTLAALSAGVKGPDHG